MYEFGPFCLDVTEHRLLRDGHPVPLTPKVFDLLCVLVQNAGHLVEKDRLLNELWAESFVEEANLTRGISVLRKALGGGMAEHPYIETVPKLGYRFVANVLERSGTGATVSARHDPARDLPAPLPSPPPEQPTTLGARRLLRPVMAAGTMVVASLTGYAILGPGMREVSAPGSSIHRQLTFTGREMTPTVSPDGERIAYVSNESPEQRVVVQVLADGRQLTLFRAPEAGWLRWSPDGSALMFWARGARHDGLYVVAWSGGAPRRIASRPFVASWSPDGSQIAVAQFLSGEIALLDTSGQLQRSLALRGTRGWIADLDWSPANDRLLVVADDSQGRHAIWAIHSDGSGQAKLVEADTEIAAARWAPGGKAIYQFRRDYQVVSVYKTVVDSEGDAAADPGAPLISGLESDGSFGLSGDGRHLVYARAPYYSNLWLVEASGAGKGNVIRQTQLTKGTSVIERPRVSPDGTSIVFNMGTDSRANLYTMPAAGGPPRQLTFLNAFSVGGAWSSDGRSIAFASTERGNPRLWIVGADGSAPHPMSAGEVSDSFDVTWSPGLYPLYQQPRNRNFSVVDPESRRETPLIRDGSVGWTGNPAYSPDGRNVAVFWNRETVAGLWIVGTTNGLERLIYKPADPSETTPWPIGWSHDGMAIYAVNGKRAAHRGRSTSLGETITDAGIFRVPVSGGQPTLVLSLPFGEIGGIAMFPDGRRFVCAVYSSRSDVWVVDDFDASAQSTIARRGR